MDKYGILDGYEDGHGEDDEKGSRAVPSRTAFGAEAAFIKEFPCYGGVRSFFFGLVKERNWAYRCELTMPQIELMQSDLPHSLYIKDKGKDNTPNITSEDYTDAVRANEESLRRSIERRRRRQQEQGYTVNEIFKGEADND